MSSTRQRLIDATLLLFAKQGIAETTTKQIAEQGEVNEVTLFRQFGNKQGLLLAVLEESEVFDRLAPVVDPEPRSHQHTHRDSSAVRRNLLIFTGQRSGTAAIDHRGIRQISN